MILALITIFGREYELVLRRRGEGRPSLPPPTFDTVAEPVEPCAPGLAKTRPALRLVREVA